MGYYDTGSVCENGHAINGNRQRSPEFNTKFCSTCGAKSLDACPSCNADIKGEYHVDGVVVVGVCWSPPHHCHECGAAYPWTAKKAEALQDVIDELDELSSEERERLKASVPDIVANTPKSETAALWFKKVFTKLGQGAAKVVEKVVTNVATQAVKESMGL